MSANISTGVKHNIGQLYGDWFLPSLQELANMRSQLYGYSVGNFTATTYWSSSEVSYVRSSTLDFNTNIGADQLKSSTHRVRACRSFIVFGSSAYALRDTGPAGGLIFHKEDNGDGYWTYYESALVDQSISNTWSNVTLTLIGTTSESIGEGANNSAEIIAQEGHTDSAAKLCHDLIL